MPRRAPSLHNVLVERRGGGGGEGERERESLETESVGGASLGSRTRPRAMRESELFLSEGLGPKFEAWKGMNLYNRRAGGIHGSVPPWNVIEHKVNFVFERRR